MDWKGLTLVFLALVVAGLSTLACKGRDKNVPVPTGAASGTEVTVRGMNPTLRTGVACINGHYCLVVQSASGEGVAMQCPLTPEYDQRCVKTVTDKEPIPAEKAEEEEWPPKER